jgi:hypothetical protein
VQSLKRWWTQPAVGWISANAIEVNLDVFKDDLSGESQTLEKSAKAIPTQGDVHQSSQEARHLYSGGVQGILAQQVLLLLRAQARCRQWSGCTVTDQADGQQPQLGLWPVLPVLATLLGFKWNHKRVYRFYKKLGLNLRIKPRKLLILEKP